MTVGATAGEALAMLVDGALMVIADDLARGANPRDRKAPIEEWDRMFCVADGALLRVAIDELTSMSPNAASCVLADVVLHVELAQTSALAAPATTKTRSQVRTLHRPVQDSHCVE